MSLILFESGSLVLCGFLTIGMKRWRSWNFFTDMVARIQIINLTNSMHRVAPCTYQVEVIFNMSKDNLSEYSNDAFCHSVSSLLLDSLALCRNEP